MDQRALIQVQKRPEFAGVERRPLCGGAIRKHVIYLLLEALAAEGRDKTAGPAGQWLLVLSSIP